MKDTTRFKLKYGFLPHLSRNYRTNCRFLRDRGWYQALSGAWRDSHACGYIPFKDLFLPHEEFLIEERFRPSRTGES